VKICIDESDQVCADIPSTCVSLWCRKKNITVRFLNCGTKPEKVQMEAAELLAKGTVDYSGIIGKAAIAHWNRSIRRNPRWSEGPEPVKAVSDLLGRVRISMVYIHVVVRKGGRVRLGFAGSWELDDEHGLGVLIQDDAAEEIGREEVAFTEDDAPLIERGSDSTDEGDSPSRPLRRRRGTIEECGRSPIDVLAMVLESMPRFRRELEKQLAKARKEISGLEARLLRTKCLPGTPAKTRPTVRKATSAAERHLGTRGGPV
jgi:hypothetical protein